MCTSVRVNASADMRNQRPHVCPHTGLRMPKACKQLHISAYTYCIYQYVYADICRRANSCIYPRTHTDAARKACKQLHISAQRQYVYVCAGKRVGSCTFVLATHVVNFGFFFFNYLRHDLAPGARGRRLDVGRKEVVHHLFLACVSMRQHTAAYVSIRQHAKRSSITWF
jgi:hypothetical protein